MKNKIVHTKAQLLKLEQIEKTYGTRYAYDLAVPCAVCGAKIAAPCTGLKKNPLTNDPIVHFARRLKSVLLGLR